MSSGTTFHSVRDLRRRWKPKKEKLLAELSDHSTCVRLHRTFSWLQRCEAVADSADADLQLICLWIGFNGLYGQWHQTRREPMPDRPSWREFLERILKLDETGYVRLDLVRHIVSEALRMPTLAIERCGRPLLIACERSDAEILTELLRLRLDVEAADSRGSQPLHIAAAAGAAGCIELLARRGAAIDALDAAGETPLHHAVGNRRATAAATLVKLGADAQKTRAKDGKSAIELAEASDEAQRRLALATHLRRGESGLFGTPLPLRDAISPK